MSISDAAMPELDRAMASAYGTVIIASDARLAISRLAYVQKLPIHCGMYDRLKFRRSPDDDNEVWIIKTRAEGHGQ